MTVTVKNQGSAPSGSHIVEAQLQNQAGQVAVTGMEDRLDRPDENFVSVEQSLPAGDSRPVKLKATTPRIMRENLTFAQGRYRVGGHVYGKAGTDIDESNNLLWGPELEVVDAFGGAGQTDPALGYTAGAMAEMRKHDSESLPYTGEASWNAQEILSKWGQVDNSEETDTDPTRCGPTAVIAGFACHRPRQASTRRSRAWPTTPS